MCCDMTVCSAPSEEVGSLVTRSPIAQAHVNSSSCSGRIRRNGQLRQSLQMCRPSFMTMNPVRQCARCRAVNDGVAQAAPLFSDHAPREVHLWQ
jgi:hypothetical protein